MVDLFGHDFRPNELLHFLAQVVGFGLGCFHRLVAGAAQPLHVLQQTSVQFGSGFPCGLLSECLIRCELFRRHARHFGAGEQWPHVAGVLCYLNGLVRRQHPIHDRANIVSQFDIQSLHGLVNLHQPCAEAVEYGLQFLIRRLAFHQISFKPTGEFLMVFAALVQRHHGPFVHRGCLVGAVDAEPLQQCLHVLHDLSLSLGPFCFRLCKDALCQVVFHLKEEVPRLMREAG